MRKYLWFFTIGILCFGSCTDKECTTTYSYIAYEPIFKSQEEIDADVVFVDDRVLENPGKFFYYGNLILINERGEGVHIVDNSDVKNPQKVGFIAIEGNEDIALSDHYLYADTWRNILVIDIESIQNPKVVNVINDVKDEIWAVDDGTFLVGYEEVSKNETFSCEEYQGPVFQIDNRLFVDVAFSQSDALGVPSTAGASAEGQAGSLTRMALFNGHFYYINDHTMHIFDVADLSEPDRVNEVFMEWGIETIFPYRENLFIGANNGMHIFDNSVPSEPVYLSTFEHANACDPVVVQDDLAYVTLRNGTECENFTNQLDVVDVSDLLRPELLASFPMHNPHGLAVRDEYLYLCEAEEGIKVFDITEPEEIDHNQIDQVSDFFAFDVISVSRDLLLMIGDDGFYQFDSSNPSDLEVLSSIKVGQ